MMHTLTRGGAVSKLFILIGGRINSGLVTLKALSCAGGYNGQFGVIDVYMKREGCWQLALSTGEHAKLLSHE